MEKSKTQWGFTVVELLVGISILAMVMSVSLGVFYSLNKSQAIKQSTLTVATAIRQARSLTLASKDGFQYGVHFGTSKAVLFKGTIYSDSDPNNQYYILHPLVEISNINLGGVDDILFQKLSGTTEQPGTITLSLKDGSKNSTLSIFSTGITEIQ
jgi:prepilin-type N-terminal cleavage/methylation domain-containing protein